MYSIKGHKLLVNEKEVAQYPTPNMSGTITPKYLVLHYTASSMDAHGIGKYFQNPAVRVSAHLNLSEDGTWTQSVPLNKRAWHAGKSRWAGISGLNSHSIGIEVCNPGPLTKTSTGKYKSWWGKIYDENEYDIFYAKHPFGTPEAYWIAFSEAQNEALIEVGILLKEQYKLKEAIGHDMISPGRKTDPGPAMDQRIYDRINGGRDSEDEWGDYVVTSNRLNVRSGPSTNDPIVTVLKKGDVIDKISLSSGWLFVELGNGLYGYVHSNFVKRK